MYASFDIRSSIKRYRVSIVSGLVAGVVKDATGTVILCDRYFAHRLSSCADSVIDIEATEAAKSLDRMAEVIARIREAGGTRQSRLVAVGGGTIQDIATFCASIYMRGIDWRYAPTTLLGMVDSCIGGKSAINVGPYKNIVGNYYPPDEILIDLALVATLGIEQKVAGLCEAAKICYVCGEETFNRYLALDPSPEMDETQLAKLVELSLRTKQWFIETDEFDRKERLFLNFGHTYGHAIEGATHFRISHGVAVGVGMLAAVHLARSRAGAVLPAYSESMETHIRWLLGFIPGLTAMLASADVDDYFECFTADKKHTASAYTVVGVCGDGTLCVEQFPRDQAGASRIRRVFEVVRTPELLGSIPIAATGER